MLGRQPVEHLHGIVGKRIYNRAQQVGNCSSAVITRFRVRLPTHFQFEIERDFCFFQAAEDMVYVEGMSTEWKSEAQEGKSFRLFLDKLLQSSRKLQSTALFRIFPVEPFF